MGNYVVATDANFQELINSDKPVLVDFWAEWCGPCKMIGPIVEELAGDVEGQAIVAKMDVDANSVVPATLGIRSIPTLMIFKNGELKERLVGGNIPKAVLSQNLLKHA
jgi:thioredoxin 1